MLPAEQRLRQRADFEAAVRGGRRVARGTVVLHARLPEVGAGGATAARAGLVVSRAVGGAVVRNRVKRRLRHLLRPRLAQLPPGSMLVVRANPAAGSADSGRLARDLDAALGRLR